MTKISIPDRRSSCPIASALDLLGDKWSLLIVRDIGLLDRHRYSEFQRGGEGVPTNILAGRLKRLGELGVLERRRYQERPPRFEYHLTTAGRDLLPVLRALACWSGKHVEGVELPPQNKGRRAVQGE